MDQLEAELKTLKKTGQAEEAREIIDRQGLNLIAQTVSMIGYHLYWMYASRKLRDYKSLLQAMARRDPNLDPIWMEQYAEDKLRFLDWHQEGKVSLMFIPKDKDELEQETTETLGYYYATLDEQMELVDEILEERGEDQDKLKKWSPGTMSSENYSAMLQEEDKAERLENEADRRTEDL